MGFTAIDHIWAYAVKRDLEVRRGYKTINNKWMYQIALKDPKKRDPIFSVARNNEENAVDEMWDDLHDEIVQVEETWEKPRKGYKSKDYIQKYIDMHNLDIKWGYIMIKDKRVYCIALSNKKNNNTIYRTTGDSEEDAVDEMWADLQGVGDEWRAVEDAKKELVKKYERGNEEEGRSIVLSRGEPAT